MTDYTELKCLAEVANSEFPLAPWAYEPHGDTGTYGVGVLQNDQELCVMGRQDPGGMLVVEPVATDVAKEKYAAFIAACSPGIVLGLISALESKSGFLDDFIHAHKSLVSQIDQLKAEVEALRKDARRWNCVRNAIPMQSPYAVWREGSHVVLGKDADDLVDNFLLQSKEAGHE